MIEKVYTNLDVLKDTKANLQSWLEEKSNMGPTEIFSTQIDSIDNIPLQADNETHTGHLDEEGLRDLGWSELDILHFKKNGIYWEEEDDLDFVVTEENKNLYQEYLSTCEDYTVYALYTWLSERTEHYQWGFKFDYGQYLYYSYPWVYSSPSTSIAPNLIGVPGSNVSNSNTRFGAGPKMGCVPPSQVDKVVTTMANYYVSPYMRSLETWNASGSISQTSSVGLLTSLSSKITYLKNCKYSGLSDSITSSIAKPYNRSFQYLVSSKNNLISPPTIDFSALTPSTDSYSLYQSYNTNYNMVELNWDNYDDEEFYFAAEQEQYAFTDCANLLEIPRIGIAECAFTSSLYNTFRGTDMFKCCYRVKEITLALDSSIVSAQLYRTFYHCYNLEVINFENEETPITSYTTPFTGCGKLRAIYGVLNVSGLSSWSPFTTCYSLEEVSIKGLGANIDLSYCPNLFVESLVYLIENLDADSPAELILGEVNLAKLTDEQIAIATDKGWTVA